MEINFISKYKKKLIIQKQTEKKEKNAQVNKMRK